MTEDKPLPRPDAGHRTYFVSRHHGAWEWAKRRGISADYLEHLDIYSVEPGDKVIGDLPADMVADIVQRGGRYLHISLCTSPETRGKERTADEMEAAGAHLVELTLCRKGRANEAMPSPAVRDGTDTESRS